MFNSTNLTLSSDVDEDSYMFCSHEISLTPQCIISKYVQIKIKKGEKTKIMNQLNTGANEIQ